MSEPSYGDLIVYIHAFIMSVAHALIVAGVLTRFEIGTACRRTAEGMRNERARSELLQMAETLEAAGVDGEPAPLWTPEVILGGKDGNDKSG